MQLGPEAWGHSTGKAWTSGGMDTWKALEFYGHLERVHSDAQARMKSESVRMQQWAEQNKELLSHIVHIDERTFEGRTFPPDNTGEDV